MENWPTVGRGKILVTCQSELLSESGPIATAIEVPPFTVAASTELILQILGNKSAAPDEVEAANRLSAKLGGLALAVDVIARKIKISRQFRSVTEYLPHFEQNENQALKRPKRGNGDWYSKSFDELGKKGFQDLSNDAAEMLGILFMSPESIPLFLFTDNGWTQILPGWTFLEDTERIVHLRLPNHWTCQANFQSVGSKRLRQSSVVNRSGWGSPWLGALVRSTLAM